MSSHGRSRRKGEKRATKEERGRGDKGGEQGRRRIYLVARVTISQVHTAWMTGDSVVSVAILPKYFISL